MDPSKINPYTILQLGRDFTLQELKNNYKRLALALHPDRCSLDQTFAKVQFQILTHSYKTLLEEYNRKQSERGHDELKMHFDANTPTMSPPSTPSKKFNIDHFNQVFDQVKHTTPLDKGYDAWMQRNDPDSMQEKLKQKHKKQVIKYQEPETAWSTGLNFSEIGVDKVKDFSGTNDSLKKLNYMDYKVAHTTTNIIDPETVAKRKEYKSVEDLNNDRSNIQFTLSPADMMRLEAQKRKEAQREARRLETMKKQDEIIQRKFEEANRKLLT